MKLSDVLKQLVETMAAYGDLELNAVPEFHIKSPADEVIPQAILRKRLAGDPVQVIDTSAPSQAQSDAAPLKVSPVRMNDTPVRVPIVQNIRR
jgi:hypothetical protein